MYAMTQIRKEPAPTIKVYMSSWAGKRSATVLPDSEQRSQQLEQRYGQFGHHPDNLLPSTVIPRAVNGSSMTSIGRYLSQYTYR